LPRGETYGKQERRGYHERSNKEVGIQDFMAADVSRSGALTMEEFEAYFKQTGGR